MDVYSNVCLAQKDHYSTNARHNFYYSHLWAIVSKWLHHEKKVKTLLNALLFDFSVKKHLSDINAWIGLTKEAAVCKCSRSIAGSLKFFNCLFFQIIRNISYSHTHKHFASFLRMKTILSLTLVCLTLHSDKQAPSKFSSFFLIPMSLSSVGS